MNTCLLCASEARVCGGLIVCVVCCAPAPLFKHMIIHGFILCKSILLRLRLRLAVKAQANRSTCGNVGLCTPTCFPRFRVHVHEQRDCRRTGLSRANESIHRQSRVSSKASESLFFRPVLSAVVRNQAEIQPSILFEIESVRCVTLFISEKAVSRRWCFELRWTR